MPGLSDEYRHTLSIGRQLDIRHDELDVGVYFIEKKHGSVLKRGLNVFTDEILHFGQGFKIKAKRRNGIPGRFCRSRPGEHVHSGGNRFFSLQHSLAVVLLLGQPKIYPVVFFVLPFSHQFMPAKPCTGRRSDFHANILLGQAGTFDNFLNKRPGYVYGYLGGQFQEGLVLSNFSAIIFDFFFVARPDADVKVTGNGPGCDP